MKIQNNKVLAGKTALITGASRGIGKEIAMKFALAGANVAILAKTKEPHPKLPGTIYSAAKEIEDLGGVVLPMVVDVRDETQIIGAVSKTVEHFGGLDIVINNASAISLTDTENTPMKRYDLMQSVNARATFATSQAAIPYLKKSTNPHILSLSPPLNLNPRWFAPHTAYTISKYGMSMTVLGLSAEFAKDSIAINALWPRTTIATAAIHMLGGDTMMRQSRTPAIVADAALYIVTQPSSQCTGNFFLDDDVLSKAGITDLSGYANDPTQDLLPDLFLDL